MKKHMLKETNDMRRLMGLDLLNEEMESAGKEDKKESGDLDERWEAGGVPGVYDNEEQLDRYEKGEDSSMSMPTMNEEDTLKEEVSMEEKDAYCQKEFGKDYKDCTKKQQKQCDDHCGKVNEDSEGEETYNYGEDEGADHKEEEHLEDEEEMAPHDRIKAIEDHLEALKKDQKIELIRKKIKKNRDEKTHAKRNK